jgi:hypothetical protein
MDVQTNAHTTDYDTVAFLRFLPARAGEEVRTFKDDGPSGKERPPGFSELGCSSLLAFWLGACERPFTFLCALPWIFGTWPFDRGTWGIGDDAANSPDEHFPSSAVPVQCLLTFPTVMAEQLD